MTFWESANKVHIKTNACTQANLAYKALLNPALQQSTPNLYELYNEALAGHEKEGYRLGYSTLPQGVIGIIIAP